MSYVPSSFRRMESAAHLELQIGDLSLSSKGEILLAMLNVFK